LTKQYERQPNENVRERGTYLRSENGGKAHISEILEDTCLELTEVTRFSSFSPTKQCAEQNVDS